MSHSAHVPVPDWNQPIWRYMKWPRLIQMLEANSLWFTRLEVLQDKFEGRIPKPNLRPSAQLIAQQWPYLAHAVNGPELVAQAFKQAVDFAKPRHLVSCWYVGNDESADMWDAYGRAIGSVAIKTYAGALALGLDHPGSPLECFASKIQYIDHNKQPVDVHHFLGPFFSKGRKFGFEQELRFLIHTPQPVPDGLQVEVDLTKVSVDLFVRTGGRDGRLEKARAVIAKHGLNWQIAPSAIRRRWWGGSKLIAVRRWLRPPTA